VTSSQSTTRLSTFGGMSSSIASVRSKLTSLLLLWLSVAFQWSRVLDEQPEPCRGVVLRRRGGDSFGAVQRRRIRRRSPERFSPATPQTPEATASRARPQMLSWRAANASTALAAPSVPRGACVAPIRGPEARKPRLADLQQLSLIPNPDRPHPGNARQCWTLASAQILSPRPNPRLRPVRAESRQNLRPPGPSSRVRCPAEPGGMPDVHGRPCASEL
jgi:hypothetical protein